MTSATSRHFTAWMCNDPAMLDQPYMDITVLEDVLNGFDPDDDEAWSTDSSKPPLSYSVTRVAARNSGDGDGSGDAVKGIEEAERLLREAGWRVVGEWRDTPSSYIATVEREND